jgi:PAS domain S-box-containing protein
MKKETDHHYFDDKKSQRKNYYLLLHEFGTDLARVTTINRALVLMKKLFRQLPTVSGFGIYLLNPQTLNLELVVSSGFSDWFKKQVNSFDSNTREYKIVQNGGSVFSTATNFTASSQLVQKEKLSCVGVVPMKFAGQVIGALNFGWRNGNFPDEELQLFLENIATQLGGTILRVYNQGMLQMSLHNFRLLFESIDDLIFILDEEGKIVRLNPVACKRLGYPLHELVNQSFFSIHHPRQRNEARAMFHEIIAGSADIYPFSFFTSQKELVPVETRITRGKWEGEDAVFVISRDVSEKISTEEKYKKKETLWQFALESTGYGIWEWNIKTHKVYYSPQWKKMLGYNEDEVSDSFKEWESKVHPNDIKRAKKDLLAHLSDKNAIYTNEHRLRCKNGSYLWIQDRGKITSRDKSGKPEKMIGTHIDITARKKLEKSLKSSLKKEKELNRLKSQFVSMASHEFRTPLATMQITADLLEEYWDNLNQDEVSGKLQRIKSNVQLLKRIVEKTMDFSNFESGKFHFTPQSTNLVGFISNIVDEAKYSDKNNFIIDFIHNEKIVNVNIDRQMIGEVLNNLLSNSMKYSSPGSTIQIKLEKHKDKVQIVVSDHGIGVPDIDKKFIFDAFQRGTNIGNVKGTGLGLALSKQFVEQHKGVIYFKSEVNVGTVFYVELPAE